MAIILEKDELDELMRLNDEARRTPVIAMSVQAGLEGRDFSSQAWDRVRDNWEKLGRKYGFNPEAVKGIDRQTGEVKL